MRETFLSKCVEIALISLKNLEQREFIFSRQNFDMMLLSSLWSQNESSASGKQGCADLHVINT